MNPVLKATSVVLASMLGAFSTPCWANGDLDATQQAELDVTCEVVAARENFAAKLDDPHLSIDDVGCTFRRLFDREATPPTGAPAKPLTRRDLRRAKREARKRKRRSSEMVEVTPSAQR